MRAMSSLSTEYVGYEVTATVGGGVIDPSTSPAGIAFVNVGAEPVEVDWHDATWQDGNIATVLVGPANGGIVLADGVYDVWLRVLANPEHPTRKVGNLQIS